MMMLAVLAAVSWLLVLALIALHVITQSPIVLLGFMFCTLCAMFTTFTALK